MVHFVAWGLGPNQRLHEAWSYRSLFIPFGNKYTLAMDDARTLRTGNSTMMFHIHTPAGNREAGGRGGGKWGQRWGLCSHST